MFEQTFKNIDDLLYKDAGADSELDYIEQTSWVLFLRYLDNLEFEKKSNAELEGKSYVYIIDDEKLSTLLELKYSSVQDAIRELGDTVQIRNTFIGFQKYLYAKQ